MRCGLTVYWCIAGGLGSSDSEIAGWWFAALRIAPDDPSALATGHNAGSRVNPSTPPGAGPQRRKEEFDPAFGRDFVARGVPTCSHDRRWVTSSKRMTRQTSPLRTIAPSLFAIGKLAVTYLLPIARVKAEVYLVACVARAVVRGDANRQVSADEHKIPGTDSDRPDDYQSRGGRHAEDQNNGIRCRDGHRRGAFRLGPMDEKHQ